PSSFLQRHLQITCTQPSCSFLIADQSILSQVFNKVIRDFPCCVCKLFYCLITLTLLDEPLNIFSCPINQRTTRARIISLVLVVLLLDSNKLILCTFASRISCHISLGST